MPPAPTGPTISYAPRCAPGASVIVLSWDDALLRQSVRPDLELDDLARRPFAAFHVERSTGADRGPQTLPLPAAVRVVDATIHPLGVEAERVRHAQDDPFAILESQQAFGE